MLSLQRRLNDQIISFEAFADYVNSNIKSVHFISILSEDMDVIRRNQKARFQLGKQYLEQGAIITLSLLAIKQLNISAQVLVQHLRGNIHLTLNQQFKLILNNVS